MLGACLVTLPGCRDFMGSTGLSGEYILRSVNDVPVPVPVPSPPPQGVGYARSGSLVLKRDGTYVRTTVFVSAVPGGTAASAATYEGTWSASADGVVLKPDQPGALTMTALRDGGTLTLQDFHLKMVYRR